MMCLRTSPDLDKGSEPVPPELACCIRRERSDSGRCFPREQCRDSWRMLWPLQHLRDEQLLMAYKHKPRIQELVQCQCDLVDYAGDVPRYEFLTGSYWPYCSFRIFITVNGFLIAISLLPMTPFNSCAARGRRRSCSRARRNPMPPTRARVPRGGPRQGR